MHTGSRSPCGNSDPVGLPPVHQAPSQALVQLHLTGNQPATHPNPVPQRPAGSYGRPAPVPEPHTAALSCAPRGPWKVSARYGRRSSSGRASSCSRYR